ncbi:MAG: chromate transporter [Clostridia bacterium]|nr:chromate transporter [Clostridia bacterium]MBO7289213.1 chromate transporter [Clostridia bacterium]
MKELLNLFFVFARIGGFTFGGGYAMLPMIQKEIVESKKWATDEEIMNYYAVGQCTPGVIAVNVATFIGYKLKGFLGAVFATLGVIFPSVVIITVIAAFISNFTHIAAVQHALGGINVIVSVLVLNAVINLWKKGVKNLFGVSLFALAFITSVFFDLSPIYAIIVSVICGILWGKKSSQKGGNKK